MSYLLDLLFRVVERFSNWLLDLFLGKSPKPTPPPQKQPTPKTTQKAYVPSWERNLLPNKSRQSKQKQKPISTYVPKRMKDANAPLPPKPKQSPTPIMSPVKPAKQQAPITTPSKSMQRQAPIITPPKPAQPQAPAAIPSKPMQQQAPIITPFKPMSQPSRVYPPKPVVRSQQSKPIPFFQPLSSKEIIVKPTVQPQSILTLPKQPKSSATTAFAETCAHYYDRTGQGITQSAKDKGAGGEMRTFGYLCSHFPKENIFCDVYLPFNNGVRSQVDLILITGFEIYIIECKDWSFPVYGSEDEGWFYFKNNAKHSTINPVKQNSGHVNAFLQVFPYIPNDRVIPVVIFNNLSKFKVSVKGFVMRRDDFVPFVEKRRTLHKPIISKAGLQDLRETLACYSVQSEDVKNNHLKYAQSRARKADYLHPIP